MVRPPATREIAGYPPMAGSGGAQKPEDLAAGDAAAGIVKTAPRLKSSWPDEGEEHLIDDFREDALGRRVRDRKSSFRNRTTGTPTWNRYPGTRADG